MKAKRALRLSSGALLAMGLLWLFLSRLHHPFPPPVQVTLSQSNAPVRVFPGVTGVFFILPDGSLWRWGQPGGSAFARARMPEPVGTNTDWVEALAANNHCLGLRRDGTVWEWGWRGAKYATTPEPAGPGTNWIGIAAGDVHSLALKRDGTLWAWGDNARCQLGESGPSRTEMAQVGTETNWMAVSCGQGSLTCALKRDGTFWIWGTDFTSLFPQPFQALTETNWVQFETETVLRARNRRGELWQPFRFRPGLAVSAPAACFLITTNAAGRFAQAYCGKASAFEVRADGTLWEAPITFRPATASTPPTRLPGTWQRVDRRSDWVGVWGT
ncbi:MAG TPA: hypothetical protein VNZ22_05510, partial [Bacillota bacterium]|nr:hypothetical protein [Bacillota bacterium]